MLNYVSQFFHLTFRETASCSTSVWKAHWTVGGGVNLSAPFASLLKGHMRPCFLPPNLPSAPLEEISLQFNSTQIPVWQLLQNKMHPGGFLFHFGCPVPTFFQYHLVAKSHSVKLFCCIKSLWPYSLCCCWFVLFFKLQKVLSPWVQQKPFDERMSNKLSLQQWVFKACLTYKGFMSNFCTN